MTLVYYNDNSPVNVSFVLTQLITLISFETLKADKDFAEIDFRNHRRRGPWPIMVFISKPLL